MFDFPLLIVASEIIPLSSSFANLISSVGGGGCCGFRFSGIFFSGSGALNNVR